MVSSTQAPTEKHLERWICANPHLFGLARNDTDRLVPLCKQIVAQQIRLTSGIADLLAWDGGLRVIELKKSLIDWDAALQVMRYLSDVRAIWTAAVIRAESQKLIDLDSMYELLMGRYVGGLLVGHDIADRRIVDACAGINVRCVGYFYHVSADRYIFGEFNGTRSDAQVDDMIDQHSRVIGVLQQQLTAYFAPRMS